MTIEELAQIMAVGNNGGTWSDHYTDDQKNVWRDRARDVLAKMTEKAPIAPADDETVERLECWANDGFSVSPESALALIARIRQDQVKLTLQETISKQAMDHGSLKANQYVEACRERDAALARIKVMDDAILAMVDFHNGQQEKKRPDVFQRIMVRLAAARKAAP